MAKKKQEDQKAQQQPTKEEEIEKQMQRRMLKSKAEALFQSAREAREKYDWDWLTRDLFRRGYHFSTYDQNTRTVLIASRQGVKFPINLLWTQMRSVKNQVTNFKPKWEVLADGLTEEAAANAKYSGRLLDYYFRRLGLRKKIKQIVMQGLLFSVGGPWQIGFDPSGDNGRGEVYVWLIDTYDFYIDPHATSLRDAEYCVKAVRKTLSEITTNPDYEFYGEVPEKGEEKLAESPSKQFLLQALKTRSGTAQEEEEEGVILKECWIKTRVSLDNMADLKKELEENDEDVKELREGEVLMRIVHYIDSREDPLKSQLKRRADFPFVLYEADINPTEIYGESWAKHIIPINRVLNALESSTFMFNYRYAVGRIVLDKNSGVRVISNQHGDFIEKNRGAEVTSLPLQPLPASYENQINHCRQYIEDLGGSHEVSLGRIPAGVKSGIGIAELKQADSTNSSDLVDNLEDFLEEVGQKILREIAQSYNVPKVIKDLGMSGESKHFVVIGELGAKKRKNKRRVKIGVDEFDLAVIGLDNEIRVTIGSWLAYTKTARQERIKELYDAGLIDQKTALTHLEFSDVSNIIEGVRKEEVLKQFRGTAATGGEGQQVSDEEIARQENLMMTEAGRAIEPLVTDNHTVHRIVHQEVLGAGGNPLVEQHMVLHEELSKKPKTGITQQPMGAVGMMEGGIPTGEKISTPGVAGMGGIPTGLAPAGEAPASPEEEALMRSLAEVGGGG